MATAMDVDPPGLSAITDEQWLVARARSLLKTDMYAAKAWLITASTLFPRNFSIQFEAYWIEKSSQNKEEAARLLEDMYRSFPSESSLWNEVSAICQALHSLSSTDQATIFMRELFAQLPSQTQCQMLLKIAESSTDMMEQCQMMIVVLGRFPDLIPEHGVRLVEKLLTTEKHSHLLSPVNCYRKMLVHDVLPLVLKGRNLDISSKQIHRWLQKSIEFFVCYVSQPPDQDTTPTPDFNSPTKKVAMPFSVKKYPSIPGLPEKEAVIGRPWESLFDLVSLASYQLNWQIGDLFSKTSRESQWQFLLSIYQYHNISQSESSSHIKQLLLGTCVLFFDCLFQYSSRVESDQFYGAGSSSPPSLALVEQANHSHSSSKKPNTENNLPQIQASASVTTPGGIIQNFMTAFKCWELLHSSEALRKEFCRLLQHWHTESWRWLASFEVDALIFQGAFSEAVNKQVSLQTSSKGPSAQLRGDLRLACCYYRAAIYSKSCEVILRIVSGLPQGINADPEPCGSGVSVVAPSSGGRQLQLMSCQEAEVLPFCVSLLRDCLMEDSVLLQGPLRNNGNQGQQAIILVNIYEACLKDKASQVQEADDTLLGHVIILLQYDWPKQEALFSNILQKIKRKGSFMYRLFFHYIINIDILEEFAFIDNAKVNLDILPTSTKVMAQQRTVTRGVNKGVKEDFKVTMEKQVARSDENIESVIRQFLTLEKDLLLDNLN